MNIRDWNERYTSGETGGGRATPLLVEYASKLPPGTALDGAIAAF